MKKKSPLLSPAQITGLIFLPLAFAVYFIQPLAAIAIALFYIIVCLAAVFFPKGSFYMPTVSRGNAGKNQVALTFDDGPSQPTTKQVLDLLDKYSVKATFFVSGVNALKHPEIIRDIITRGHAIGNHSFHHNPFLMLGGYNYLYQEVFRAQEVLSQLGVQTFAFRPPVGIINPKLPSVLDKLGLFCVTFSCRALDAGNRRVENIASGILKKVKADDIILLHDVYPRSVEANHILLSEIEKILQGLAAKGLEVVPLSDLIGREVMKMKG